MRPIFLVLLLGVGVTFAHDSTYHALQAVKLCLDFRSIQVIVKAHTTKADDLYEAEILEHLRQSLQATLTNYQVPFSEKTQCGKGDGFILSVFYVKWSDKGRKEPYYIYASATQVGDAPNVTPVVSYVVVDPEVSLGPESILGNNAFDTYASNELFMSDFAPSEAFDQVLPTINEDAFKNLALAWWEDNPNGLQPFSVWPYLIGSAMTLVVCGVGLHLHRRQKSVP